MGNASSKAARKLSRDKAAQWAPKPLAFEHRDQAIETDAKDPHLAQNLSRLGPVSVHPTHAVRAQAAHAQDTFRARARAEQEAEAEDKAPNRLRAASLAALLDARKAGGTTRGRVDDATLQLLWGVNTPSIDARTVVRTRDEHGEESVTVRARWVDPGNRD